MRKLFILLVLVISVIASNNLLAQNATISSTGEVERNGNTFSSTKSITKNEPEKTIYTWKDSKGTEYPIYISKSGSTFIIKINENGEEKRQYMKKEISEAICAELGREYKSKFKRK